MVEVRRNETDVAGDLMAQTEDRRYSVHCGGILLNFRSFGTDNYTVLCYSNATALS